MFQKDPYNADSAGRIGHNMRPGTYNAQQGYHPDQPYRDYDHPPSQYDVSSGGGYPEPKYRNYDSNPPYENSVPHYDQQQWSPYSQPHSTANSQAYDHRLPYSDGHDSQYTPPLRYDEPPPPQGFDGRPRYGKPTGSGPIRYDEPLPHAPVPDYNQGPAPQQKSHKPQQYDPVPVNSEGSPTPPPKPETPSPSPMEALKTVPARDEQQDDPAMRPQSVLTRVKMFENKRSVSMDRARETGDLSGNKVNSYSRYIT